MNFTSNESEVWRLSEEGAGIAKDGSHEVQVFNAIPVGDEGCSAADIQVRRCIY